MSSLCKESKLQSSANRQLALSTCPAASLFNSIFGDERRNTFDRLVTQLSSLQRVVASTLGDSNRRRIRGRLLDSDTPRRTPRRLFV
jgi:hypothetical protein